MGLTAAIKKFLRLSDTVQIANATAGSIAAGRFFVVSPETALGLPTVNACVRLISETVGALPCQIYRRDDRGGKSLAQDHRLYYLLHDSPNADMTPMTYFETICRDLLLYGNHFSEIFRNTREQITAIYPLEPAFMDKTRAYGSRRFVYQYADPLGVYREIDERDILFIPGAGYNVTDGLAPSPMESLKSTLRHALASEDVATGIFNNAISATGLLTTERTLSTEQRANLRAMIKEQAGLLKSAGGLLVLESDFKYTPITIKPVDAQVLESRLFSVEQICTFFRVPPHMVGHVTKTTSWGSGIEQQNQAFATHTLKPYLDRIEEGMNKAMMGPIEAGRYTVEFNLDGLLRADTTARANLYSSGLQNGWMSRNEVRSKENLPAIDGGDIYTVQVNQIPLEQLGQEPVVKNAPPEGEENESEK